MTCTMTVNEYTRTVTYPLSLLNTPVWIFDVDQFNVVWANEAGVALWDAPNLNELQQRNMAANVSRAVCERLNQYCVDLSGSTNSATEHWTFFPKGRPSPYECAISVIDAPNQARWLLVNATRQDKLSDSDTLYRSNALLHTSVCVSVFDRSGELKYSNPAARNMLGAGELSLAERFVEKRDWDLAQVALEKYGAASIEAQLITAAGTAWHDLKLELCPDPISGLSSILVSETDVSDRHAAQQQVHKLAYSDTLTGLPNRTSWLSTLEARLQYAHSGQQNLAILFVDLDRFKVINDTLGHALGDQLLIAVARRLNSCIDSDQYLARLGGDEFTLLVNETEAGTQSIEMASRIINALATTMHVEGHELSITPSIGISLYPDQSTDADVLMQQADLAMYAAKEAGGGYRVFQPHMTTQIQRRLLIENDLREAIDQQVLQVYYQPKLQASDGVVTGMEALIRWNHPTLGWVPPPDFIAVAEETGMIRDITRIVLLEALSQQVKWANQGRTVSIAVNVSPVDFSRADFSDTVQKVLDTTGVNPEHVELEITETMLMADGGLVQKLLGNLTSLGIKLAIDDFGSGYSNLGYLQKFPLDSIKIDRSFLADGEISPVIELIIGVGKTLSMSVVAEGVETEEQRDYLIALGCDQLQGFLISEPLNKDLATQFLLTDKYFDGYWPNAAAVAA